jgi:putative flippase GtrA
MLSTGTGSWSQPALRVWTLAQRFQKFLVVGAVGLGVNLGSLFFLHSLVGLEFVLASPIAIAISMVVTFTLNEAWTWQDRGTGLVLHRAMMYVPINTVGLIINWQLAVFFKDRFDVHPLLAQFIGAGVAAVWNFGLNNVITWRD